MKTYKVGVRWVLELVYEVEADNPSEAQQRIKDATYLMLNESNYIAESDTKRVSEHLKRTVMEPQRIHKKEKV